jgi:hypothetical protein
MTSKPAILKWDADFVAFDARLGDNLEHCFSRILGHAHEQASLCATCIGREAWLGANSLGAFPCPFPSVLVSSASCVLQIIVGGRSGFLFKALNTVGDLWHAFPQAHLMFSREHFVGRRGDFSW